MEDIYLKTEKLIIVLIITISICIVAIIGIILFINSNNETEDDEIRKLQEGGTEYTTDELKGIEITIKNLDNNIKEQIKYNKFIIAMKEYIYENGLIEADEAQCISVSDLENEIILQFRLNNSKLTILTAKINIKNYSYEFSDSY